MKLGDVDMLYRVVEKQQRECSDPFAKKVWDIILKVISICPEIDPETLPIVRQLRAENDKLKKAFGETFACELMDKLDKAEKALARVTAERDAAVECIYNIEDDLDRGNDNDWAREHISEWSGQQK